MRRRRLIVAVDGGDSSGRIWLRGVAVWKSVEMRASRESG